MRDLLALLVEDLHDRGVRRPAGRGRRLAQVARAWRSRRRRPRSSRRCCRGCRRSGPSSSSARSPGSAEPGGGDDLDARQVVALERLLGQRQDPLQHHRDHHERVAPLVLRWSAGTPRGRTCGAARPSSRAACASARWAKPQVWNSGAAMWVRQPWRSGIRDSSETAASMPASLRGAPFGVPVVPEVRMTIRACRSGGVERRSSVVRRDQRLEGVARAGVRRRSRRAPAARRRPRRAGR